MQTRWIGVLACCALQACVGCDEVGAQQYQRHVQVTPPALDFGATFVGTSLQRTVEVRNTGNAEVRVEASVDGEDAFGVSSGVRVVEVGGTTTLPIEFLPERAGAHTAQLHLSTNAEEGRVTIALTGEGAGIPRCDDSNPCTQDQFDVVQGACVFSVLEGVCDDGNACTQDDRCQDGACRGVARSCDDFDFCTLNLCDAANGCAHPPDLSRCADDDPCTADLCDPVTGCAHAPAPDGTPCAPVQGCTSLFLCASGACTAYPVPDNFPCFDGDICSVGDRCVAGVCEGMTEDRPAEVAQVLPTFGGDLARAAIVDASTLVFLDEDPRTHQAGDTRPSNPVLTRVAVGAALSATSRLEVPYPSRLVQDIRPVIGVGDNRVAVLAGLGGAPGGRLVVAELGSDGSLATLFTAPLPSFFNVREVLFHGDEVWACTEQGVWMVTPHPDAAPTVSSMAGPCAALEPLPRATPDAPARFLAALGERWVVLEPSASGPQVVEEPPLPWQPVNANTDRASGLEINGALVAVGHQPPSTSALSEIALVDRPTWALRGRVAVDPSVELMTGFCLDGPHLVALRRGNNLAEGTERALVVWDVSNPEDPVRVHQRVLLSDAYPGGADGARLVGRGTALECAHGLVTFGAAVYRKDESGTLSVVTGPEQGSIRSLARVDGRILTVHPFAVRDVVLPANASASFANTQVLEVPASAIRVVDGAQPRDVFPADFNRRGTTGAVVLDPRQAIVSGTGVWANPLGDAVAVRPLVAPGGQTLVRSAGDAVWSVAMSLEDGMVERHVLRRGVMSGAWSSEAAGVPVAGSMEIFSGARNFGVAPLLVPSEDGGRAVVAECPQTGCTLLVVEDANGPLRELARREFPPAPEPAPVISAAIQGDVVMVVLGYPSLARQVRSYALDTAAHTLTELARLDLEGARQLLVFDGFTAVLSTETGIAFVRAVGAELSLLGAVPTPAAVTSALVEQDRLLLATETSVTVVTPPCPVP